MAVSTTTLTSTIYSVVGPVLPLQTTFTPPSSCLEPTFSLGPLGYDGVSSLQNGPMVLTRGSDPRCFPDGYVATSAVTAPSDSPVSLPGDMSVMTTTTTTTTAMYETTSIVVITKTEILTQSTISPVGCPVGYTNAGAQFTMHNERPFELVTCCPSAMTPSSQSDAILSCVGELLEATVSSRTSYTTDESPMNLTSSTVGSYKVWAQAILALTPTSTPTSTPPPTPAPPTSQSLTTGERAVIAIGVSVGALVFIALAGIILWRRRKRASGPWQEIGKDSSPGPFDDKAELPGDTKVMAELGSYEVVESDAKEKPPELEPINVTAELDGIDLLESDSKDMLPELETPVIRMEVEGDLAWSEVAVEKEPK